MPKSNTLADLKYRTGTQGWNQFLQGKSDMLARFDSAKNKAKSHEVETYHGKVAEAELRNWLITFLPKRYGVTSGFIISPNEDRGKKFPHFDVIIYDQLESPILWIDENPDTTKQGTSAAIPVEHVRAVLEVKSRWTAKAAKDAVRHLHDLDDLLKSIDDPKERYKKHLPPSFFCGVVFFEVCTKDEFKPSLLGELVDANLRGYLGGIVLRGENLLPELAGNIELFVGDQPQVTDIGKNKVSLIRQNVLPFSSSIEISENRHIGAMVSWTGAAFSKWAFDILALLNGTYRQGFLSSKYGMTWRTSHKPKDEIISE